MPNRIDLVPMEAEEFLSGIQRQIDAGKSGVQYFYPYGPDGPIETRSDDGPIRKERSFDIDDPGHKSLSHLKRLGYRMEVHSEKIGSPPPNPGTFRGAIGQRIILTVRRLLWWYTRSISAWADVTARVFKEQLAVLEDLETAQEQTHSAVLSVQKAVSRIESRTEETGKQHEALASRICLVESNIESARQVGQALVAELHALESRVAALEGRIADAGDAQHTEQIRAIQAALAVEKIAREALSLRLEIITKEMQDLRSSWKMPPQSTGPSSTRPVV